MTDAEGATGAYLAVLAHLGWASPCFDIIFMDELNLNGERTSISLKETCPKVVLMWAKRRMADLDAQGSELAKRIGGTPDLEPLKALVKTKAAEQSPATLSLRAMGEGGWHCQSDLFKLGLVESSLCQACFGLEGTFAHRCVGCPARAEDRKAYKDQKIIVIAQSAVRADDPLFKYGVPLKVPRSIKPKLQFRFI